MSDSKHTPGPWINDNGLVCGKNTDPVYGLDMPSFDIYDASEWNGDPTEGQENAAFIVRACNSHEDLLAACKGLVDLLDAHSWGEGPALRAARAAIAKACS